MKRLRKVIIGVLCMLLLSALSHATEIEREKAKKETVKKETVEKGNKVKFAWDGPELTNDQKPEDCVVKYHLYVIDVENVIDVEKNNECDLSNKDLEPVLIDVNEAESDVIKAEREFPDPGEFYIGVATAIYCPSKEKKIRESKIAWSCNKFYTNGDPFLVKVVEEKPQIIE